MKQLRFLLITAFITTASFAQNKEDTTDHSFHDNLLDHLVGKWNVSAVAHGFPSTAVIEASWAYNHQHLHLHFKGNDTIPWIGTPMEFDYFIGYNHNYNRYVIHGMSVFGDDNDEGFWYASRNDNELKITGKPIITSSSDSMVVQRLTWQPETNTWLIQSRQSANGKEGDVFLDMKLTAAKPKSKQ